MKTLLTFLAGLAAWAGVMPMHAADSVIWVNVSMKLIANSATGSPPPEFDATIADQWFAQANVWLANHGRGFRVRLVDRYVLLGGMGDTNGPSRWYDIDLKGDPAGSISASNRVVFDALVKTNAQYRFNPNALNIYMNNGWFSSTSEAMIITSYRIFTDPVHATNNPWMGGGNWLHEIGHYYGLWHTFENPKPADGGFTDFATDIEFGTRDAIALQDYGKNYAQLPTTNNSRDLVDRVFFNSLSYHQYQMMEVIMGEAGYSATQFNARMNILTPQQLDHWADTANSSRHPSVTGYTRFVSNAGGDGNTGLQSGAPKQHLWNAATNSVAGDIVMLRAGNYNERITITNRVILRAAAGEPATIGQ